jgi:hypothetical protein
MADLDQVPLEALWFVAVASGVALAAAFLTLPRTGRRHETLLRAVVSVILPVAGLLYMFGREARHAPVHHHSGDETEATALFLFSLAALTMAGLRVVFAGYLERAARLHRSGAPAPEATGKQAAIILGALFAVAAVVTASLVVGLSTWVSVTSARARSLPGGDEKGPATVTRR